MASRIKDPASISIFIVEDDDIDAKAMERTLAKLHILNPIIRARDGVEALDMLRNNDVPYPYIILLDLNMPRMGGLEFLDHLRGDPDLRSSVVFVLTTSEDENDRIRAYDKNVAGYVVMRGFSSDFVEVITMLESYWRIVTLPST